MSLIFLERDAKRGDPEAQFKLVLLFQEGKGCPQDNDKAAYWYRQAAERNHPGAVNNLASLWFWGLSGRQVQDKDQALQWLRQAAQAGNSQAQANLGYYYLVGFGDQPDFREAAKWFDLACRADPPHPDALSKLAILYLNGTGVERNREKAVALLKKPPIWAMPRPRIIWAFAMPRAAVCRKLLTRR